MISVSEAFELIRRWNTKECYIVHYRGLLDFEDVIHFMLPKNTVMQIADQVNKNGQASLH
jgi:hypothetical protein